METATFFILRLILSAIVGAYASSNDKSFTGNTALSFFLSPLIGYIFARN